MLGRHTEKLQKKKTKPVHWITQGGDFHMNYTSKVEIIIPKLDATKITTWNCPVDDPQVNHKYNMITRREILSKLQIYLRLSDNTIRLNQGAYEVCTDPVKKISDINFNTPSDDINEKSFQNEE